jgi:lysyl-tRNA synthetase class 1
MIRRDVAAGTVTYVDPDTNQEVETPVTGGRCKLQWKPDWAMRWYALGVDYEMAGKDLIDSVKPSGDICRALGGAAPEGFNYELFLDETGQKISKSKGNGLTIEEWLTYGPPESLALFMYLKPREAKKLHFDVIPRCIDDYLQFLGGYDRQDWKNRLGNPVWHIHAGSPPAPETVGEQATQVSFSLLMNLVAVANAETKEVLWGFLRRYAPGVSPETHPRLDALVGHAIAYFRDRVKPKKSYRAATEAEAVALRDLSERLRALAARGETDPARIQDAVYDAGRRPEYEAIQRDGAKGVSLAWFNTLYEILLGEPKGPRFGSFAAIYGLENTCTLIGKGLSGELIAEHEAFLAGRKG